MSNYFSSDFHGYHKNICRGVSSWKAGFRDFDTIEQMNEVLITNINKTVQANDTLRFLGDWTFGGYDKIKLFRDQINCNNIVFIWGNHDENIIRDKKNELRKLFSGVYPVWEGKVENQYMFLCHYAMKVWNLSHEGAWHLYGHSHGSLPDDQNSKSLDIGVDTKWYSSKQFPDVLRMTTNFDKSYYIDYIDGSKVECQFEYPESIWNVLHERFTPYSMDELNKIMSYKKQERVDHH